MVFRNVIVCRMVPGSEDKIAKTFGHYDRATRPQDFGVIGRILLSHHDLYIHIVERNEDPAVSGQTRGLPAFKEIAEAIGPYVTPYPRNWQNPSHSVAKEFYRWAAEGSSPAEGTGPDPAGRHLTVIVGRIKPGAEDNVARIFTESDAGTLPVEMSVTARWLYSIDDVYVHLLERSVPHTADDARIHDKPKFGKIMEELSPYIGPYNQDAWRGPVDAVAKEYYRWRAED
ncbi:TcmI family type II polyketide cyclase [Solwaraspora sp. WMMD937]|uniref:TcmI family type II polyketide cyclase n=1 Tax=Solwaraspora sp. WMMD937 TaxID=3016090 RepID=UPI002499B841|nr:TcmI family type II polyketide cyclase [Solwaraspora sp. WMMD937]WFE19952.1 TcmI family type II polyketide cyclase [Solwaraspora sp. WMMD937]